MKRPAHVRIFSPKRSPMPLTHSSSVSLRVTLWSSYEYVNSHIVAPARNRSQSEASLLNPLRVIERPKLTPSLLASMIACASRTSPLSNPNQVSVKKTISLHSCGCWFNDRSKHEGDASTDSRPTEAARPSDMSDMEKPVRQASLHPKGAPRPASASSSSVAQK